MSKVKRINHLLTLDKMKWFMTYFSFRFTSLFLVQLLFLWNNLFMFGVDFSISNS